MSRTATLSRQTKETKIELTLDLDDRRIDFFRALHHEDMPKALLTESP